MDQSGYLRLQSTQQTAWLEQISPCPVGMQSSLLQRWWHQRIMGISRCWWMVPGPINGSLQMWSVLHSQDLRISNIGFHRISPQHCQMPNMTLHQHFCALTDKLAKLTTIAGATNKGRQLTRQQQDGPEGYKHNLCYDTWGDTTCVVSW